MNIEDALKVWCNSLSGKECNELLEDILKMDFDTEIHFPATYLHLHYASLTQAEKLLDKFPDKTDLTYIELHDFYRALEEADNGGGVFPLSVPYRTWWDGPHLVPAEFNALPLESWFPARVDCVDDKVYLTAGQRKDNKNIYVFFELDKDDPKYSNLKEDDILEFGVYGKGEEEIIEVYKHDSFEPWMPEELLRLKAVVQPAIDATEQKVKEFTDSFYDNNVHEG